MTQKIAAYFNCNFVFETGREIIANSNFFNFDDLYIVAKEHNKRIEKAIMGDSPITVIDTDIHITQSYARFIFQREIEINKIIDYTNKPSLYFYLNNDVEYVQDGTRLSEIDRNLLDISHRKVLFENNIEIIEINGNWNERFEKIVKEIKLYCYFNF
ncbi:MAG: hypothetical protein EAZ44_10935 [Cytophagia bacterium]|nr:MAG: hypothetical protein EAZ44_10935 [Cytophagia bacterium]TAG40349.1 MAG: hypothetical protein EAZ31_08480 [Cytophagia bacterium]